MYMQRYVVIAMTAAVAAGAARASELYGTVYVGSTPLYTMDQVTGRATAGPIIPGYTAIGDLTSDPASGRVWATDLATGELLLVDPGTGVPTSIGRSDTRGPITSLAFNAATGKLYGNTTYAFGGGPDTLYEIDPSTAFATPIGVLGVDDVYALAFGNDGDLYGVAHSSKDLVRISTVTGNATPIGNTGRSAIFDIAARPEDGVMFGVDSGTYTLYRVDLATGGTTPVGPYGDNLNLAGLAFVPAPGTALMLGGLGLVALRRRR